MNVPQVDFDFLDPAVVADPYPIYERVRRAGRIVWNGTMGAWVVTGFDECREILTDHDGDRFITLGSYDPSAVFWFDAPNMITVDGSEHDRLRRPVAHHFTRTAVAKWEPRIREVVEALLAPLQNSASTFDLADFTRIPTIVVADMLGVPPERHDDFQRWSQVVTGNVGFGHERPETKQAMLDALAELNGYLSEELERHRTGQFDDLLSSMLAIPDWTAAEIRSAAVNFLLAGYDTTAKLMTMVLFALESNPEQRALVAGDRALVPNAIEEVLRWGGPSHQAMRAVARDTEFAGAELKRGQRIHVMLGAANYDPTRWDDPARFDVTRPVKANLGFGFGHHLCIGAPLARLETKVAIGALLELAPTYQLTGASYGDSLLAPRGFDRGALEAPVRTG